MSVNFLTCPKCQKEYSPDINLTHCEQCAKRLVFGGI